MRGVFHGVNCFLGEMLNCSTLQVSSQLLFKILFYSCSACHSILSRLAVSTKYFLLQIWQYIGLWGISQNQNNSVFHGFWCVFCVSSPHVQKHLLRHLSTSVSQSIWISLFSLSKLTGQRFPLETIRAWIWWNVLNDVKIWKPTSSTGVQQKQGLCCSE